MLLYLFKHYKIIILLYTALLIHWYEITLFILRGHRGLLSSIFRIGVDSVKTSDIVGVIFKKKRNIFSMYVIQETLYS